MLARGERERTMREAIKVARKDVAAVVDAAFPSYRGRKFRVEVQGYVSFHDTNWGGGSRNQYVAVRLADGRASAAAIPAPWNNNVEGKAVDLPSGVVVVEHSIFQGKDMGIRIYVRPDDTAKLLPQ